MTDLIPIDGFLVGLETVFNLHGVSMTVLGVILGIAIGATPGLSPAMGVALLVPFTYGMDPAFAFILFVAAYQAANYGGSITAIAVNAPGTPASAVTAIDGYQLTKEGKAGLALGTAVLSSTVGGLIGAVILILLALPIAKVALKFGPAEYFALAVFGLTTVIAFAKGKLFRTGVGVLLGLFLAYVGMDPFTGEERYTFGVDELFDGVPFLPVMIGLFALAEIFTQIGSSKGLRSDSIALFSSAIPGRELSNKIKRSILKSSLIGTFIGVIPGAGATIASFISYGQAQRSSKEQDKFGKGSVEGIAASEAANSSSVGGALIPLLSLGVPGSATDAVLLGALTLHGLVAGPELFQSNPELVYGIFVTVLLANVAILLFGILGNKLWLMVIKIPKSLLFSLVVSICILGSYTTRNSLFDCWLCLAFGVLGMLFKRIGILPAGIVLGLVLGDMVEMNFRRAVLQGGYSIFYSKPICLILIILSVGSLATPLIRSLFGRKI